MCVCMCVYTRVSRDIRMVVFMYISIIPITIQVDLRYVPIFVYRVSHGDLTDTITIVLIFFKRWQSLKKNWNNFVNIIFRKMLGYTSFN